MAKQVMDMQALRDFAAALRRGERQEEADSMREMLEKQGKKALELAFQAPDLLLFMADQALISKGDIDKVLLELDWTADPTVTGRLLAYKKNPPENAPEPKEKKAPAPSPRDDWTTEKLPDGTWKLKSYKGKDTIVHIPEILGKARVSCLGRSLFYPYAQGVDETRKAVRRSIEQVVIPYGITEIEEGKFGKGGTFCGCTGLKSVKIPASLTSVGAKAFQGCENLTDIVLSEGTTYIGSRAFDDCYSLEIVTIPKSVTSIGSSAFTGCSKLTVHAPAGSYAEQYAKENNIPFVAE